MGRDINGAKFSGFCRLVKYSYLPQTDVFSFNRLGGKPSFIWVGKRIN